MIDKGTQNKIASCKELQGKSVSDIVGMKRFTDNLSAYMTAQREDRKAPRKMYADMVKAGIVSGGKRVPAHPIDKTLDWSVADFTLEYLAVVTGVSQQSHAVREYVRQLGQQAYNLTIAQIVCDEFPELTPALLPKSGN